MVDPKSNVYTYCNNQCLDPLACRFEGHLLIGTYYGISSEIPPSTLHIRVQVWLYFNIPSVCAARDLRKVLTETRVCVRSYTIELASIDYIDHVNLQE